MFSPLEKGKCTCKRGKRNKGQGYWILKKLFRFVGSTCSLRLLCNGAIAKVDVEMGCGLAAAGIENNAD